jgi:hypothetical protein
LWSGLVSSCKRDKGGVLRLVPTRVATDLAAAATGHAAAAAAAEGGGGGSGGSPPPASARGAGGAHTFTTASPPRGGGGGGGSYDDGIDRSRLSVLERWTVKDEGAGEQVLRANVR